MPEKIKNRIKDKENYIVAHFHQDELALIERRTNSNFCVMTSTSTDGKMMKRFLELLGYKCAEGSATRDGSKALLTLIKFANNKKLNPVMAVDGPRGPIYKVKKGVIVLAKETGAPILPVGVKISRAFCFNKSWNKALLPKPFSTVEIKFGRVIDVPKNTTKDELNAYAKTLEDELSSV
ncbi:MAG: lysophospholipid acyltransferase family protein, partial [Pseudomonadota bacterium]